MTNGQFSWVVGVERLVNRVVECGIREHRGLWDFHSSIQPLVIERLPREIARKVTYDGCLSIR